MQITPSKPSCRSCCAKSKPRTESSPSSRSMFWSITAMSAGGSVAGSNDLGKYRQPGPTSGLNARRTHKSFRPMTTSTKLRTSSAVLPMEPLRLGSA
eukprot:scaffold5506_cov114-Isochrysis_galbana.AAC.1